MKQFNKSLLKWTVSAGIFLCPLGSFAQGNIEMVTYFPVPYVAYNNIYVSEQFDVGTRRGAFSLVLGSDSHRSSGASDDLKKRPSLQAGDVLLKSNTLFSWWNADVYTDIAVFGNSSSTGDATLNFTNLYIKTLNTNKDHAVKEINAENVTVEKGYMYLFPGYFGTNSAALPACKKAGNVPGSVKWQPLTFGGKSYYFLECNGDAEPTPPEPVCSSYYWEPIVQGEGNCEYVDNISYCTTLDTLPNDGTWEGFLLSLMKGSECGGYTDNGNTTYAVVEYSANIDDSVCGSPEEGKVCIAIGANISINYCPGTGNPCSGGLYPPYVCGHMINSDPVSPEGRWTNDSSKDGAFIWVAKCGSW